MDRDQAKQTSQSPIGIGIIGCGTVGSGVARLLLDEAAAYSQRVGRSIELRRVLVLPRHLETARKTVPDHLLTTNPDDLYNDKSIHIITELAGGVDRMFPFVHRALDSGRHVVTANKALLARKGVELFKLARDRKVALAFEASCGGGIPLLNALKFGLGANRIDAVFGILNGTCNYILTQMTEHGTAYADALAEAQRLGFAEADPTMDVSGADTLQKLSIIASLAFGVTVPESAIALEGIDKVQAGDIAFARELGYRVKLLAIGHRKDGGIVLRVCPAFVPASDPIAQVHGSFNALSVYGHAVGHTLFYGHGAGRLPTASAVVGDILNIAGGWYLHAFQNMRIWPDQYSPAAIADATDVLNRFYLRIDVRDEPGVLAGIAAALGSEGISIASVMQHEVGEDQATVPIIVTTHQAAEGAMSRAAKKIGELSTTLGPPMCIRIIEMPEG
jgi:homoserine dehydrogenase